MFFNLVLHILYEIGEIETIKSKTFFYFFLFAVFLLPCFVIRLPSTNSSFFNFGSYYFFLPFF